MPIEPSVTLINPSRSSRGRSVTYHMDHDPVYSLPVKDGKVVLAS
jgi:hypothetical protein